MKKKFQDWLRRQVGCPKCAASTRLTSTQVKSNANASNTYNARRLA